MIEIFKTTIEEILHTFQITHKDDKIILWGAGDIGNQVYHYFRSLGVDVFGYCDNNENLWNGAKNDVPIFSPVELKKWWTIMKKLRSV